ncbi:MAG: hypothetical protein Fur006_58750 [Coleofasciculaceae cyanobacterium]
MDSTNNLEVLKQLVYVQPSEAARTLALALQSAFQNDDKAELVRVAEVVKALAKPLKPDFEPLLFYARGVAKWASGDITGAIHEFRSLRKGYLLSRLGCYSIDLTTEQFCIKITDVLLDMPAEILWHVTVPIGGGYFSRLPTQITDAEILKSALQQLGFTVKTNADVRGYRGQRVTADVVAILEGEYDLGWSRNSDGKFDLIGDLSGVSVSYNQTELTQSIMQQYALNKTLAEQETSEQDD